MSAPANKKRKADNGSTSAAVNDEDNAVNRNSINGVTTDHLVALGANEEDNILESLGSADLLNQVILNVPNANRKLTIAIHQLQQAGVQKQKWEQSVQDHILHPIEETRTKSTAALTVYRDHIAPAQAVYEALEHPSKVQARDYTTEVATAMCNRLNFLAVPVITIHQKIGFSDVEEVKGMKPEAILAFLSNSTNFESNPGAQSYKESIKSYLHKPDKKLQYGIDYTYESNFWTFSIMFCLEDDDDAMKAKASDGKKFKPVKRLQGQPDPPCWTVHAVASATNTPSGSNTNTPVHTQRRNHISASPFPFGAAALQATFNSNLSSVHSNPPNPPGTQAASNGGLQPMDF